MKKLVWLIKQSLILDIKFLRVSKWSINKKIVFLGTKYLLIIKHIFEEFELGKSNVYLFGEKIYYDSKFGIAGYQRILATHQNMISIAGIKEATTVIDIGANVGFFSKFVRGLFSESHVYSFEPIPVVYSCLQRNFDRDMKIKTYNIAISDMPGTLRMSFNRDNSAASKIDNLGEVEVRVDTLDNFVEKSNISTIDILKIDTETFEAHVVRGSQKALSITKYLFIEVTIDENPNYTISSLMKLLSSDKFDFQLVSFRNYADESEGKVSIMDCLLTNIKSN